jgi:hypothetical protein
MRKRTLTSTIALALVSFCANPSDLGAFRGPSDLKFEDHAVSTIFKGKPARAKLTSGRERKFRTRFTEDSRLGPNFAGHYTVVFWGCGTGCAQTAIVDAHNGRVSWVPLDWTDIPDEADVAENRNFRLNSKLLILTRSNYDAHATYTEYAYLMTKNGLRLIRKRLVDPAPANRL